MSGTNIIGGVWSVRNYGMPQGHSRKMGSMGIEDQLKKVKIPGPSAL